MEHFRSSDSVVHWCSGRWRCTFSRDRATWRSGRNDRHRDGIRAVLV